MCGHCRRHVAGYELVCPFCGATCAPLETRPLRAGRFARAAVFAGAALAGCDQGKLPDKPVTREPVKEPSRAPRVNGFVLDQAGAPLVGAWVDLAVADKNYRATTDERGHYVIESIEPGAYSVSFGYSMPTQIGEKHGFSTRQVTVSAGSDQRVDAKLEISEVPVAMPYGAPPARRRMV